MVKQCPKKEAAAASSHPKTVRQSLVVCPRVDFDQRSSWLELKATIMEGQMCSSRRIPTDFHKISIWVWGECRACAR